MYNVDFHSKHGVVINDQHQVGSNALDIASTDDGNLVNVTLKAPGSSTKGGFSTFGLFKSKGEGDKLYAQSIEFSGLRSGEIAAITHDAAAVDPRSRKVTAVSAEQVVVLLDDHAALATQVQQLSAQFDALAGVSPADLQATGDNLMSELSLHGANLTALQTTVNGLSTSMATQIAALTAALTEANTANAAALAAANAANTAALATANATISALATQVNTLKTGFCPPAAAGRHLLSDLTPIVPPAECVKAAPAAVTNPTNVVTTTLSLSGVDLASFSTASVAAALAATAGINVADVDVVVTDFPVSTTVSFTGVALTSLTAAQVTGITNAIDANLPAAAMVPALGTVTPTGRRLLDLSFPVTVTAVGASTTQAAATQTAVTSAATLAAAALAAGLQSSAASATPATVSAAMTITVRAASAASAASITAALSPSNTAAITTQLAAAGVANTGVAITAPVVAAAAPSTSSAEIGQDKKDLLALLVLLVIPVACAAYLGGKYLERRRAEQAACTQVFGKEQTNGKSADTVLVVESA